MFKIIAVLFIGTAICAADVQIKTSYNADGQTAETTISSNGNRMRYDYGNGVVVLRYCDQGKMIQIDDKNKSFLALPSPEATKPAAPSTAAVTDTGERKELFGKPARHLKIVDNAEDKDGKKERTETDGWYLDMASMGACFGPGAVGADRGYPASYSIVTYAENGKPMNKVSMQVVSMAEAPLASSMFEVPTDYKDSTPREISKTGAPKAAGAVRIGALPVHDKSSPGGKSNALFDRLVNQLMEAKLDLIELDDGPQEAIGRKAQETACDFVLYTDVTGIDKPTTSKVGGVLHKAAGLGHVTGGDGMEAHVDYRLVPAAGGSPLLASTAIGKAGTQFNVKGAIMLASSLVPMAMTARMLSAALNPAMMNALVSARGVGVSMATADPMMGGLASVIQMVIPGLAQGKSAQNPNAMEAVAIAIDQEVKAIVAQVKPAGK